VSSRNWRAVNLANWEARVPIHVGSGGYDVERYVEDAAHLGDVVGFDASRWARSTASTSSTCSATSGPTRSVSLASAPAR
jgi:hypothetical protein